MLKRPSSKVMFWSGPVLVADKAAVEPDGVSGEVAAWPSWRRPESCFPTQAGRRRPFASRKPAAKPLAEVDTSVPRRARRRSRSRFWLTFSCGEK